MFRLCLFFLLLIPLCSQAQDFKYDIQVLASDSMGGRLAGTISEKKAANFLDRQFGKIGVPVHFQEFPFEADTAINVIAYLNKSKDSTIIISAHYDHIGLGINKARDILKTGIHPGADDNASGVALMLALAQTLSVHSSLRYNFLFIGFSAHEEGLYGSAYFSKSTAFAKLKVRAILNFDMVGRLDSNTKTVTVSGAKTDTLLYCYFLSIQDHPLHLRFDDTNLESDDLKNFKGSTKLRLHFTTGLEPDYHKVSDTEDKINYQGMKKIYDLVLRIIPKL